MAVDGYVGRYQWLSVAADMLCLLLIGRGSYTSSRLLVMSREFFVSVDGWRS